MERQSSYRCSKKIYSNENIACKNPNISHIKMEQAFIRYIQRINDFTEIEGLETEDTTAQKETELIKYIADCEAKISNLTAKKRRLMEQYVNEELPFEDYKSTLLIFNEKLEALDGEQQRARAEVQAIEKKQDISPDDIILNLNENWGYLDNDEKMIFLQRFVEKIYITVEKERRNSNIVRIERVEFR